MTDELEGMGERAAEPIEPGPDVPRKSVDGVYVALEGEELADFLSRLNAPPPSLPRTILAGWFKAAISQMGKKAAVAAAVNQQPEWKRELWENATSVREDDADVIAIATALNIDLKAVFDRAEEIRAATRGGA